MALELPPELQVVLNLVGVDWPQVNEDEVARLADQLRKLASTIDSVQMAADKALSTLSEAYHGASADALAELWGNVSKFSGLVVEACGTTATALNAAALVIEACKGATLAQLVATQGELAIAAATGPWNTATVVAAAKQIISSILDQAVSALGHALAQPVSDLVETVVKDLTGSGSGPRTGSGFGVDLTQLATCALELRGHADDMDSHGSSFRRIVDSLDVGQPGDAFGRLVIAAAEQIATTVGEEVLKRLLDFFRGSADRMDQVGRNLTENEDTHAKHINGIVTGQNSPLSPHGLKLAGGVGDMTAHKPHDADRTAVDGPSHSPDHAQPGNAGGGALTGAVGLLPGSGAKMPKPPAPNQPAAATADHADSSPQQQRPVPAGSHSASGHHGTGQTLPRTAPRVMGGDEPTQPSGTGLQSVTQSPGLPNTALNGQADSGRSRGDGVPGQPRVTTAAQQHHPQRARRGILTEDPAEPLAEPHGDDITPDY